MVIGNGWFQLPVALVMAGTVRALPSRSSRRWPPAAASPRLSGWSASARDGLRRRQRTWAGSTGCGDKFRSRSRWSGSARHGAHPHRCHARDMPASRRRETATVSPPAGAPSHSQLPDTTISSRAMATCREARNALGTERRACRPASRVSGRAFSGLGGRLRHCGHGSPLQIDPPLVWHSCHRASDARSVPLWRTHHQRVRRPWPAVAQAFGDAARFTARNRRSRPRAGLTGPSGLRRPRLCAAPAHGAPEPGSSPFRAICHIGALQRAAPAADK